MASRIRLRRAISAIVLSAVAMTSACSAESPDPVLTVGLVTNNANGQRNVAGFVEGMAALGYEEGENVHYIYAGKPLDGDQLAEALDDMVDKPVDLIFTAGTPTGVAAHAATQNSGIPVVFGVIADPIRAGVIEDLTVPGGNMTGVKLHADQSRRLELLLELVPEADKVFVPFNPDDAAALSAVDQVRTAAPELGIDLVLGEARTDDDVVALLAELSADVDAIFLVPDSTVNRHLAEIVAVATELGVPTSGPSIAQVEGGAVTTYGFVHHDAGAQAARIADQVLRGADPGLLPVENTESFLAVNLAAAEAIDLAVSEELLRRADIILRADEE